MNTYLPFGQRPLFVSVIVNIINDRYLHFVCLHLSVLVRSLFLQLVHSGKVRAWQIVTDFSIPSSENPSPLVWLVDWTPERAWLTSTVNGDWRVGLAHEGISTVDDASDLMRSMNWCWCWAFHNGTYIRNIVRFCGLIETFAIMI